MNILVFATAAMLEAAFSQFATDADIAYGEVTPDGKCYTKGYCMVEADAASPKFPASRALAYERAYVNAVGQFMLDFYGREVATKVNNYFMDDSSNAEDTPDTSAKGVFGKIALLTETKLDKALADEGVSPDKYASASIVEKRKLFEDTLITHTANKALHSSSGCIPVKTFECWDDAGKYYIGVVVRYDRTAKTLAECFKLKKRPALVREGGETVAEAMGPEDEMLANFGVRLYFDETGTPALLSFGQFGSSYTGKNERMAERHEEMALKQAKALADNNLTMFINSFMDVVEESDAGEVISESRIFKDDGTVTPEEVNDIVNKYRKTIRETGSDTMKGRSTVFEKTLKHPNGQNIAVVVRKWSFGTVDAVNAIDNPPPKPQPKATPTATPQLKGDIKKGRTYDF